jgi:KDO2-lipid IV(A) lauroyltransferase
VTPQTAASILLRTFSSIPLALRKSLFITLSYLFYLFVPRQRFIALHNLSRAFPEKPPEEVRKIARGVYRNIGIIAAEFFDSPSLTREKILQRMSVEGWEHCRHALEKGKGILLLTAHFGNWELSATVFALLVKPLTAIYRPLDNPILEAAVRQVRESAGNKTLPKERAMRPMLRLLKQNGVLGIMIDQNVAWYEGVFVPFFGRKACTTDGIALLALHTGAPVLPGFLIRQPDGRYRIKFLAEVETIRSGNRRQDVLTNTQRYNAILEEQVRQYPDQWLWIHHRWKTRPSQVRERP